MQIKPHHVFWGAVLAGLAFYFKQRAHTAKSQGVKTLDLVAADVSQFLSLQP